MFIFILFAIGLICLAFDSTRFIGVGALTLLFLAYPPLLIVLLVLGGVYMYYK